MILFMQTIVYIDDRRLIGLNRDSFCYTFLEEEYGNRLRERRGYRYDRQKHKANEKIIYDRQRNYGVAAPCFDAVPNRGSTREAARKRYAACHSFRLQPVDGGC